MDETSIDRRVVPVFSFSFARPTRRRAPAASLHRLGLVARAALSEPPPSINRGLVVSTLAHVAGTRHRREEIRPGDQDYSCVAGHGTSLRGPFSDDQ